MPITIKKDAWQIKDDNGNYRSAALFSTMLPNEARHLIDDTRTKISNDVDYIKQDFTNFKTQTIAAMESAGETVLESIPSDYTALSNAVEHINAGGFIYGEADGEIASFDDGADDMLLKNLTATFEANQDLNGYDHPWLAGCGKNIFDYKTCYNAWSGFNSHYATSRITNGKTRDANTGDAYNADARCLTNLLNGSLYPMDAVYIDSDAYIICLYGFSSKDTVNSSTYIDCTDFVIGGKNNVLYRDPSWVGCTLVIGRNPSTDTTPFTNDEISDIAEKICIIKRGNITFDNDEESFVIAVTDATWGSSGMLLGEHINFKAGTTYAVSAYCTVLTRGTNYTNPCICIRTDADNSIVAQANMSSSDNTETRVSFTYTPSEDFTGYFSAVITGSTANSASTKVRKAMIEIGSSVTDYAPYKNISEIVGRTGLNGKRHGNNYLNSELFVRGDSNTIVSTDLQTGAVRIINTAGVRYCGAMMYYSSGILASKPFPKGQYTISFDASGTITTSWTVGIRKRANSAFVNAQSVSFSSPGHYSFTFDSRTWTEEMFISVARTGNQTSDVDVAIGNIMMVLGSVEETFEPYILSDISVSWADSIGTVYGGCADITTGKMLITHQIVDLGTLGYAKHTGDFTYFYTDNLASNLKPESSALNMPDIKCSALPTVLIGDIVLRGYDGIAYSHESASNPRYLYISIDEYKSMTASEFKAAMSGVMLYYPLATPLEQQFTPQQITTLLGKNNIWIDDATISVTYPVDTKTYIDRKIEEKVNEMLGA